MSLTQAGVKRVLLSNTKCDLGTIFCYSVTVGGSQRDDETMRLRNGSVPHKCILEREFIWFCATGSPANRRRPNAVVLRANSRSSSFHSVKHKCDGVGLTRLELYGCSTRSFRAMTQAETLRFTPPRANGGRPPLPLPYLKARVQTIV